MAEDSLLRDKFTDPFIRDVFRPLLETNYHRIMTDVSAKYSAADESSRMGLLRNSLEACGMQLDADVCPICEQQMRPPVTCGAHSDRIALADVADELAIHIWSHSRCKPSLYSQINQAVITDDASTLQSLSGAMAAINHYISRAPAPRTVTLFRGTTVADEQKHQTGVALPVTPGAQVPKQTRAEAASTSRQPMYIAASQSRALAMSFRVPGSPLLEISVPEGCRGCTPILHMSHFPVEEEWLMTAYSPVRYTGQKWEQTAEGESVLVVMVELLDRNDALEKFESAGQPLKSTLLMCELEDKLAALKERKKKAKKEKILPEMAKRGRGEVAERAEDDDDEFAEIEEEEEEEDEGMVKPPPPPPAELDQEEDEEEDEQMAPKPQAPAPALPTGAALSADLERDEPSEPEGPDTAEDLDLEAQPDYLKDAVEKMKTGMIEALDQQEALSADLPLEYDPKTTQYYAEASRGKAPSGGGVSPLMLCVLLVLSPVLLVAAILYYVLIWPVLKLYSLLFKKRKSKPRRWTGFNK